MQDWLEHQLKLVQQAFNESIDSGVGSQLALSTCKVVTNTCKQHFRREYARPRFLKQYYDFFVQQSVCYKQGFAPCWDKDYKRLAQGQCNLECSFGTKYEQLKTTCKELGGALEDVIYFVGLDGTSVKAYLPACIPTACTEQDISGLESCASTKICGKIPVELLPVCKILRASELDPESSSKWIQTVVFTSFFCFIGVLLVLRFLYIRLCIRRKTSNVSELQESLLRSDSAYLHEHFSIVLRTPLPKSYDTNCLESLSHSQPMFRMNSNLQRHVEAGLPSTFDLSGRPTTTLLWKNIFYKQEGVQVLKGVTGFLEEGHCLAVIGAPDSGATTLLQVLARRHTKGTVSGEILLDRKRIDKSIHIKVGYIPKEDINLPSLTVRETLVFGLIMRSNLAPNGKLFKERIEAVLQLLGLDHVANTIVGDQMVRGISGGERRRVSLGVESVVGHKIILADSPTNGLDAQAAYEVIKAARVLADSRITSLMATIRQPSVNLLMLFDTCCLLSRGTVIYFGKTKLALDYFNQLGLERPLTKSIPDFLEELTGDPVQFAESQEEISSKQEYKRRLIKSYKESKEYKELVMRIWKELDIAAEEIRNEDPEEADLEGSVDDTSEPTWLSTVKAKLQEVGKHCDWFLGNDLYETSFWRQFIYCTWRQGIKTLRSPTMKAKLIRQVYLGLLLGAMFNNLDLSQRSARNRYGLVFIAATGVVLGALPIVPQLFEQRTVYYHQKSSGYFRSFAFHLSLFVCEFPIMIGEAFIFSSLLYSLCKLNQGTFSSNFWYFFAVHVELNICSWTLCLLGVILAPSTVVASAVVPTIMSIMVLFSGYLVPRDALPIKWLYDLSMISRPLKGLALNEVEDLAFQCTEEELVPETGYPGWNVTPPNGFFSPAYRACPLASGKLSLLLYGYQKGEQDKWVLLLENSIFIVVLNFLLIIVMQLVTYSTENSDSVIAELKKKKRRRGLAKRIHSMFSRHNTDNGVDIGENNIAKHTEAEATGSLEFMNLNYTVEIPTGFCRAPETKQLLFDVSGFVLPGTMVALMGSSGAGKTTLLDVLADKKTGGYQSAETLLINGKPRNKYFPRIAGYVEQMDSHLPTQTVREAIEASAYLRLQATLSPKERKARVDYVLKQLNLVAFEDEMIGDPINNAIGTSISAEIRKKVTIAVELVYDPPILFLDEPTTALDAASALAVMQTVRKTCAQKAVLCTIHQPSAEVFHVFDWMLLLQKGGRVCYFGPISKMSEFFVSIGLSECPKDKNPADYALECANSSLCNPADEYERSLWKQEILTQAPSKIVDDSSKNIEEVYFDSAYARSSWFQFLQVLKTQYNYYSRDLALLKVRCVAAAGFACILGSLFFQLGRSQTDAQSRIALVFIAIIYVGYSSILSIPKAVAQRNVHFREYSSSMYRIIPYYCAISLAEMPFMLLQIACFGVLFYPLVGLRMDGNHPLRFGIGVVLMALTTLSFTNVIASITPNADVGIIMNTVSNSIFTLFCGFLLPYDSIPAGFKFLYYISFYRFNLGFLVSNELQGLSFNCGPNINGNGGHESSFPIFVGGKSAKSPPFPYGLGRPNLACEFLLGECFRCKSSITNSEVKNYSAALNNPNCFQFYCPIVEGENLLKRFDFPVEESETFNSLLVLLIFFIIFRLLALIFTVTVQHVKR